MKFSLAHHRHTGRPIPHHHTSVEALAFLLVLMGTVLGSLTYIAHSQTISSTIQNEAPTDPAIITLPLDGQAYTYSPIPVAGTCPKGMYVDVAVDGVFAGSTFCDTLGLFSLPVSLHSGKNVLTVQDYDAIGQMGPSSGAITVSYTPPSKEIGVPIPGPTTQPGASGTKGTASTGTAGTSGGLSSGQSSVKREELRLSTSRHIATGAVVGVPMTWPVTIVGGVGPYTIRWDWGDGLSSTVAAQKEGVYEASHAYTYAKTHHILLSVEDAEGTAYAVSVVADVTGSAEPTLPQSDMTPLTPGLALAWPLLGVAGLMLFSFFIGRRW